MADEGIMALPQGTGMQGEQPPVQQQAVTSADSYDAAQTALGRVNPGEQAALKEALRQNIGNLQLTPQQLDALIQVFEYVSQHPGDYKNLLQKMLEAGVLDEGDMPPEYDPEFIGAMLAVLNEMQQMQAAGAQEPMDMSPVVQGLQPMGMASGGLADIGQYLASKGRGGDSMLAHINPEEAAMLKRRGGSGTINPNTGLPEFKEGALGGVFDAIGGALKGVANVAKDLLKSPVGRILGTIALATVLGPAGVGLSMGVAGGLAGAGTSLLAGGSVKEALVSGAMGYIGGGGTVMGVNPVAAVGGYLPGATGTGIGAAGGALNTGLATGLIGAGIGKLSGMSTEDALQMGLTSGVSAGALRAFGADDYAIKSKMLALHEAGDPSALSLYDTGNVANMKAYIDAKASPFSTPAPNPVTAPAQSSPFPGVPPATNAEMVSLGQRYSPATDAQIANLTSAGGNAVPGQAPVLGAAAQTGPADFYSKLAPGELSNSPYQSSLRSMPAAPIAEPPGFFDKALTGAGRMYDTYLSPDRAGLPSDVSFFRKYGPLAAAGTATIAAFGGMDSSPAEIDPITAGERARYAESRLRAKARRDRIEKGGYGLEGNRPLIYAADGGIMTANKVRHLYEGGDAAGYGYGEGEGAAQGAGMGGYGSMGEGGGYYTNSDEATRRAIQETEGLMRDVDTSATSARGRGQSLGANLATRSLDSASNMGSFAAPGFGDLGQFLGSNPAASTSAPSGYFGRTTIAPEAAAPVNAPAGYFGRVTIAPEAETPVGRYGRTTIAPDSSPEEAAAHMQAMQAIADGVTAQGNRNAGSFYEGADGRAKGGYIGRFSEGGDAGERRRLAQERRRGYGLEGNLLDTALAQARTGNAARPFEEYFVNNSGDQRGPGTDNTGDGQTIYGGLANLAGEANRRGFTGLGGFLASGLPVGAAYKGGNFTTADLAALGNRDAIAAMTAQNQAVAQDAEGGSSGDDGGGGARAGGGATGGGYMAKGGPAKMTRFPRRDGPINGPGTGTSDDIPAMLSDGEFVFTAKAVRNAGGGSRRKGAARMYKLMKKLEGGAVKGN